MDRETQGISDAIELLESLYEMPVPRRAKCETLFKLARRSKGRIVELGTWLGTGYIALCLGSDGRQPVWTVDDYSPKEGWAGEKYGPDDKELYYFFCDKANVRSNLLEMSFEQASSFFTGPIGLLFWDAGQDKLLKTMKTWEPMIPSGGIMAIHDTYSNLFGAKDYIEPLIFLGMYRDYEVMPGGVHVAVKV